MGPHFMLLLSIYVLYSNVTYIYPVSYLMEIKVFQIVSNSTWINSWDIHLLSISEMSISEFIVIINLLSSTEILLSISELLALPRFKRHAFRHARHVHSDMQETCIQTCKRRAFRHAKDMHSDMQTTCIRTCKRLAFSYP